MRLLTGVDQGRAVVQGAQVRSGQGQEGVQFAQVTLEPGPGQHRPHNQVPQGVAHEAGTQQTQQHEDCKQMLNNESTKSLATGFGKNRILHINMRCVSCIEM